MKWLVRLFKWAFVFVVVLVAMAFALPRSQHVERSREMAASPQKVWSLIADPRAWSKWSPWATRDPKMRIEYSGPASGAGAGWSWVSESQGTGRMRFDSAEPPRRLAYSIEFTDMGSGAKGEFRLDPVGSGTKVTWSFDSDAGNNPMMRWFGLMLDPMVGGDFSAGLAALEKVAAQ